MQKRTTPKAFTLIELLIVVAIIAILAAIAVPNFLEAQTRAKVSRAKADMRTLATGLESYRVDNNQYPKANNFGTSVYNPGATGPSYEASLILERLSTPVAYLSSSPYEDPFLTKGRTGTINSTTGAFNPTFDGATANDPYIKFYKYHTPGPNGLQDVGNVQEVARWHWVLHSNGPSLVYMNMGGLFSSNATREACIVHIYDPTNGTVSHGGIFRVGGVDSGGYGSTFFNVVQQVQN